MTALVDRATTMRCYREGVAAVVSVTEGFTESQWHLPACGPWTSEETARHVLAVARWYHVWLDSALAGNAEPPFPSSHLPGENETAMAALADRDGPGAVGEFATTAGDYIDRAADAWDLPFGFPYGTVTVGLHAGAAAAEWHLHAWDLARSTGADHEPDEPEPLLLGVVDAITTARGGLAGRVGRVAGSRWGRREPWAQLLRRSGRRP